MEARGEAGIEWADVVLSVTRQLLELHRATAAQGNGGCIIPRGLTCAPAPAGRGDPVAGLAIADLFQAIDDSYRKRESTRITQQCQSRAQRELVYQTQGEAKRYLEQVARRHLQGALQAADVRRRMALVNQKLLLMARPIGEIIDQPETVEGKLEVAGKFDWYVPFVVRQFFPETMPSYLADEACHQSPPRPGRGPLY